jgi:hypothetical protein
MEEPSNATHENQPLIDARKTEKFHPDPSLQVLKRHKQKE